MTPEEWQALKGILETAMELGASERAAYIASKPPSTRRELESLVRAYEERGELFEAPCAGIPMAPPASDARLVGKQFGPYRVLELLGEGGMGSVWLAERVDGLFTRRVALKLVHPALMGRVMGERVTREREILASLNHPNIAQLLDAGFAHDGQPYLALEYVAGTQITTYCDERGLSIAARLQLFRQVLSAVQYAHIHLVIHRDLKPSNILVTADGQVRLLDFGIAKLLTKGEARETDLTLMGGRALTPDYAAPEQMTGAPITTAADVYALGVMLYELLTGERPYKLKRDSRGALEEAILQADPAAPSRAALSEAAAAARGTTSKKLARTLRGDLDTIVFKALKKSPGERYSTAESFGEDIARHLRGEAVLAQRDTAAYRTIKFARRHWIAISVVSALILTLAAGLAATTYEATVAAAQRDAALQAQLRSLTQTADARFRDADVPGAMSIILEVLPHQGVSHEYTPEALSVFQQSRAADGQILAITGHTDVVEAAAFSPDARLIVTASDDKTARIWDSATGLELLQLRGHTNRVPTAAFSPDGKRIVTASLDKTARIWDVATGKEISQLSGHTGGVWSAAFSPDGQRVVTASSDKTARIWDAGTGRELVQLTGHTQRLWSAAFSPDGRSIVTASFDKSARTWDAATGRQLLMIVGHTDLVATAAYSPDGKRIVTASLDQTARIWDAATGQQLLLLNGYKERVLSAAFSPDGTQIVTASYDKTARTWDSTTGKQMLLLSGHTGRVNCAAFSPDGKRIVTASYDKTARTWDAVTSQEVLTLRGHTDRVWSAGFSPDGARVVTTSFDRSARVWDASSGREIAQLLGHENLVVTGSFSPDGGRVLTASNDMTARIWDATTGKEIIVLKAPARIWGAAFSPDGRRVGTATDDNAARIWDAASGEEKMQFRGHTGRVLSVAFSPDGRRLLTASFDKTARIWDAATGRQLMQLNGHTDVVEVAAFSFDGRYILTASDDKTVRIWDADKGLEVMQLIGHGDSVQAAAFSPDGANVVTASFDRTVRVWETLSGHELMLLSGHTDLVETAQYSPDGARIITASDDRTAKIWDAHAPALNDQIRWAQAAQFDPLSSTERFRLGLPVEDNVRRFKATASKCDEAAAAPFDPERRAAGAMLDQIIPDVAIAACAISDEISGDARSRYQNGRAQLANGNFSVAKRELEAALARGYRAAGVDLGTLLANAASGFLDTALAISLYQQAWNEHFTIAGFELGKLYEHGVKSPGDRNAYAFAADSAKAWVWYEKAANAGEPNALVRLAERDTGASLAQGDSVKRNSLMLESFKKYAAATERARRENWPDDAWRNWRYRRASLARLLAREGMMHQAANAAAEVRAPD
jgi:WD40 repeat protein/serine/threonine protein kinase/TPR repeat protein